MFIFLIIYFLCVTTVEADTVLIRKSDGFPIEYQSGNVSLDILLKNNPQYSLDEVERKEVTKEEYVEIKNEKIVKPRIENKKAEKEARKDKEKAVKVKLGLSDEELRTLKEILE